MSEITTQSCDSHVLTTPVLPQSSSRRAVVRLRLVVVYYCHLLPWHFSEAERVNVHLRLVVVVNVVAFTEFTWPQQTLRQRCTSATHKRPPVFVPPTHSVRHYTQSDTWRKTWRMNRSSTSVVLPEVVVIEIVHTAWAPPHRFTLPTGECVGQMVWLTCHIYVAPFI